MAAGAAQRVAAPRPSPLRREERFFSARPGGAADAIGRPLGGWPSLLAALALWGAALILLGVLLIGLGLLLSHLLVPSGLDKIDVSWSRWFVPERTAALNDATRIGSALGSTPVILAVAGVVAVVFAIARLRAPFLFMLCAMTLEFAVFLLTTLIIARNRPDVPRLDAAPPTSSYPSGHTASACTLYVGLAIVIASFIRGTAARVIVWALAVLVPVAVGLSRVYRGMHYPSDVLAGALLAAGTLVLSLLAVRSLSAAKREREAVPEPAGHERRSAPNAAGPVPPLDADAHPAPPTAGSEARP
jgi:membrane-associated phospholipid phosphatase